MEVPYPSFQSMFERSAVSHPDTTFDDVERRDLVLLSG
jgi:hypothetical protein